MGFRDRDPAFDFKESLNEFVKYVNRMGEAEQMHEQATSKAGGVGDDDKEGERPPFEVRVR